MTRALAQFAARPAGSTLRTFAFAGGCLLAAVAACGVLAPVLFSQPSVTKYGVTVVGPALVAVLATVRLPVRFLVGLAILIAPLAFVATFGGVQVTPVSLVLIAATVLAAGSKRAAPRGWLGYGSIAAAMLLVPAIASSSGVGSYATWIVETMAMGWLAFGVAKEPGGARFVVIMIVASVALQGLIAVYEFRSGHQLNLYSSSGESTLGSSYFFSYGSAKRYTGMMPDPIALGNVIALALPLIVSLAALERRTWVRVLLAAVGIGTSLGLIVSLSRMSWVGGGVGILICMLLLPPRIRPTIVTGVVATAAVAVVIGLGLGGSALQKRVTSTLNPTNVQSSYATTAEGDQLRERLWSAAIKTAEAKPLTGSGFGKLVPQLNEHGVSVPPGAHAQSWYFQLLGEAGLLGGAALLLWIVSAVRDLWTAFARYRGLAAGLAGSLVAILITWTTDIEPRYVQVSAIIAAVFGLIAAVGASRGVRSDEDALVTGWPEAQS